MVLSLFIAKVESESCNKCPLFSERLQPGDFTASINPLYKTSLDHVSDNLSNPVFQLVDSRKPELHAGMLTPCSGYLPRPRFPSLAYK